MVDLSQAISITIFSESDTYELYRKILKISDYICLDNYFCSSNSFVIILHELSPCYMRRYIYFTILTNSGRKFGQ